MQKTLVKRLIIFLRVLLGIALLLPLPFLVFWFNTNTAKNAALDAVQFERDSALALLSGNALAEANQLNERLVLSQLIENLEKPYNTIALGSSRVMQLNSRLAGVQNFYNCGLSGADYRDIMNIYFMFEKAGKLPNNMIIALDPWILNADPTKLHSQSDSQLFSQFISTRLGYTESGIALPKENETDAFWNMFSPKTLQQNLDYVINSPKENPPNVVLDDLNGQTSQIKMPDGTALYPPSYRDAPEELVNERARLEATTFLHMDGFLSPDPELCLLFHRFISYVRGQGVNVVFMLMPYNPIVYNYASERTDIYPGFFLTEPWFTSYAKMYDVPLYGSYNPFVTNTQGANFFDGLHVREKAISGFFPGMPLVLEAQKKGQAFSPWLLFGQRVQYKTAQRLVQERYEITAPEIVRQGLDEIINGEVCYLVHRYSSDGEKSTLLASYAVSRREGVIYRWDTELVNWVIDYRFPR